MLLVDFFCGLPEADQKLWKRMASVAAGGFTEGAGAEVAPQLEAQLKMLYTAVTRCCDRLILVETRKSAAGSSFFRWLKGAGLADSYYPDAGGDAGGGAGGGARLMTTDEWRQRGLQFAHLVEAGDYSAAAGDLLVKARGCFERAHAQDLARRSSLHEQALGWCRRLLELRSGAAGALGMACEGAVDDSSAGSGGVCGGGGDSSGGSGGGRDSVIEKEALEMIVTVQRCLSLGLLAEASQLCGLLALHSAEGRHVQQEVCHQLERYIPN